MQHLTDSGAERAPIRDLLQVLPALSRDQVKRHLRELAVEGRAQVIGVTPAGRWFSIGKAGRIGSAGDDDPINSIWGSNRRQLTIRINFTSAIHRTTRTVPSVYSRLHQGQRACPGPSRHAAILCGHPAERSPNATHPGAPRIRSPNSRTRPICRSPRRSRGPSGLAMSGQIQSITTSVHQPQDPRGGPVEHGEVGAAAPSDSRPSGRARSGLRQRSGRHPRRVEGDGPTRPVSPRRSRSRAATWTMPSCR